MIGAGVATGDHFGWPPLVPFLVVVAATIVAALVHRHVRIHVVAIVLIAVALMSLGAWRIAVENAGRPSAALVELTESTRPIEVFGSLAGVPYQRSSGWRVTFDLHAVRGSSGIVPVRARLLLTARRSLTAFRYGDYLRLTARVRRPFIRRNPGGFDYAAHLFRQGIDGLVRPVGAIERIERPGAAWHPQNLVEPLRRWIRQTLSRHLPDASSAILLGYLLGDTDRLPAEIFTVFRGSGTLHLLAVSGANVWLVVGVFLWPLMLLSVPRWLRTLLLLLVVVTFSFLTRNEPSVVRASLVVGLILIGQLLHRPVSILNAVGVAGMLILLYSPAYLFRPGFQLSFAAVIAIALVLGRFRHLIPRRRLRFLNGVIAVALSSAAAGVATTPIVAWHFGTIPVMGVFANLIMVPLAGLVTQLGILLLILSAIWSGLAGILVAPIHWLVGAGVIVARFFAELPGAVIAWVRPTLLGVALVYGAAAIPFVWRFRYTWVRPAAYALAAVLLISAARYMMTNKAAILTVALLDAGNARIVGIADGTGHNVWLAEEPGIDADLTQWVVDPFTRTRWGGGGHGPVLPWFRSAPESLAVAVQSLRAPSGTSITWRSLTAPAVDSGSGDHVWADRIACGRDTLLLIRDLPASIGPDISSAGTMGPGHLVVVPAAASDGRIRSLIDRLSPAGVVLFGRRPGVRHPDQKLAFWRVRYPGTAFWSTEVHGGIVIEFHGPGWAVVPTISEISAAFAKAR